MASKDERIWQQWRNSMPRNSESTGQSYRYQTSSVFCNPTTPFAATGRIACAQKFLRCYLRLPGILNDPFCCTMLLAIEWSLLRRCSDLSSEDCQCFWMAPTTPQNCHVSLGDLYPHLTHGSMGPTESSSETACRSVQGSGRRGSGGIHVDASRCPSYRF